MSWNFVNLLCMKTNRSKSKTEQMDCEFQLHFIWIWNTWKIKIQWFHSKVCHDTPIPITTPKQWCQLNCISNITQFPENMSKYLLHNNQPHQSLTTITSCYRLWFKILLLTLSFMNPHFKVLHFSKCCQSKIIGRIGTSIDKKMLLPYGDLYNKYLHWKLRSIQVMLLGKS